MTDHSIKGKTVIIAGGAKNLGGLLAQDLAAHGAKAVAIHYNSAATKADADKTVAAIKAAGANAVALQGNLTTAAAMEKLFADAIAAVGKPDIAINTVGKVLKKPMVEISEAEYDEFLREVPEFERQLVRSGVRVVKFWFSVSKAEQRRRFKERRAHPLKQWKLSPVDMASLDKWDDYTRAKEAMFVHCDTSDAPWTVIKSDCKKRARLNAMRYLLNRMPYTNADRASIGAVDPLIVGRPSRSKTLDDFIAYAKQFEGVVFATHDQVSAWWRKNYSAP